MTARWSRAQPPCVRLQRLSPDRCVQWETGDAHGHPGVASNCCIMRTQPGCVPPIPSHCLLFVWTQMGGGSAQVQATPCPGASQGSRLPEMCTASVGCTCWWPACSCQASFVGAKTPCAVFGAPSHRIPYDVFSRQRTMLGTRDGRMNSKPGAPCHRGHNAQRCQNSALE